jgi:HEPN domain-containing protein
MRPEALEEARDWLRRAQRDLLAVERALSGEPMLGDQAAFHSQQAAEKALKAFLTAHDHPFAKTHNLERLVRLCQRIDPAFIGFIEAAHTLNPYATQFRYPGGPLEPAPDEAREALRLASEVVECVRQRLFPEAAL